MHRQLEPIVPWSSCEPRAGLVLVSSPGEDLGWGGGEEGLDRSCLWIYPSAFSKQVITGTDRVWSYDEVWVRQQNRIWWNKKFSFWIKILLHYKVLMFYSCAFLPTLLIISWSKTCVWIIPRRVSCSPNSFETLNFKFWKLHLLEGHVKMKVRLSPPQQWIMWPSLIIPSFLRNGNTFTTFNGLFTCYFTHH